MPNPSDESSSRKVTEKVGSVIPVIGTGNPSRQPANNVTSGRLNLRPITANSSWYSGVAAVTAEIMPRAFWQPPGDSQVTFLLSSQSSVCVDDYFY
jgi:hypothetical protein